MHIIIHTKDNSRMPLLGSFSEISSQHNNCSLRSLYMSQSCSRSFEHSIRIMFINMNLFCCWNTFIIVGRISIEVRNIFVRILNIRTSFLKALNHFRSMATLNLDNAYKVLPKILLETLLKCRQ